MKFFFDNCISLHLVAALRCLDPRHTLVHLREKFSSDVTDTDWITVLGKEGEWIVISADPRISRGRAEREAWHESGLTAFFCGDAWANRPLMTQASQFIGWWEDILRLSRDPTGSPGAGYLLEFKSKKPRKIYPS